MEPLANHLPRAIQLAHLLIKARLKPNDTAIDATVGNGHDTTFLAKIVASEGKVIGFDIQKQAIENSREKTSLLPQVTLHHAGHEQVGKWVSEPVKAAMFNLGYLPGAEKEVITQPETTISSLTQISEMLEARGIITIVLYTGHTGGPEEASAVRDWAESLEQADFSVIEYGFLNQKNSPPSLIAIEKK